MSVEETPQMYKVLERTKKQSLLMWWIIPPAQLWETTDESDWLILPGIGKNKPATFVCIKLQSYGMNMLSKVVNHLNMCWNSQTKGLNAKNISLPQQAN